MALALVTGEVEQLSETVWKPRRSQLAQARSRLFRLQTEPWRRWANGFSTLCFVVLGAPLAILLKKSDVMTTFGFLFLPILATYYPAFIGCCDRAKAGGMPPYIVWIPNLLLIALGIAFTKRVVRY
jgi:lipopolysaccharide export system permease protein